MQRGKKNYPTIPPHQQIPTSTFALSSKYSPCADTILLACNRSVDKIVFSVLFLLNIIMMCNE